MVAYLVQTLLTSHISDGFHKVHIRNRSADDESATFQHEYFRRGQPYMISFIERKRPTSSKGSTGSPSGVRPTAPSRDLLRMSPYPCEPTSRPLGNRNARPTYFDWPLPSPTQTELELILSSHMSPPTKLLDTFRESRYRSDSLSL